MVRSSTRSARNWYALASSGRREPSTALLASVPSTTQLVSAAVSGKSCPEAATAAGTQRDKVV